MRLEMAETELIRAANKQRIQEAKKSRGQTSSLYSRDTELGDTVDTKLRPTHRPRLFGEKVDTIEWCRSKLQELIPQVEEAQDIWKSGNFSKASALFCRISHPVRCSRCVRRRYSPPRPLHIPQVHRHQAPGRYLEKPCHPVVADYYTTIRRTWIRCGTYNLLGYTRRCRRHRRPVERLTILAFPEVARPATRGSPIPR